MDEATQERIARNDATFRDANEKIAAAAQEIGLAGTAPFLCECADPQCTDLLRLPFDTYAEVRRHPRRFVVVPGHEATAGDAAEVVESTPLYHVVEKTGRAGEVAEELSG